MDYYSLFWGPGLISTINEPWDAFTCRSSTLTVFVDSDMLRGLFLTVWGPKPISMIVEPQGPLTCRSSTLAVFVDADPFHGLLLSFGVQKRFPLLSNPGVHLLVSHQHTQLWPILVRLVDYYSPFWGPKAISIVVEPQGALTCRSSTLAVLADSGPFLGLLFTVLGSRSDFHSC